MNAPVEFYLSPSSLWLRRLKEYVKLNLYKEHCVLSVNCRLYWYLRRIGGETFARLVSLFLVFSGFDDKITALSVSDMAKFTGVCERTIKKCIAKYRNFAFLILAADHLDSLHRFLDGKSNFISFNSYELLERAFKCFDGVPEKSRGDFWVRFSVGYDGLDMENYLVECFNKNSPVYINNKVYNNSSPSPHTAFYTGENNSLLTDTQLDSSIIFKHFDNPIYEPGFNAESSVYPVNWLRHPDCRAYFKKGRWYGGAIHCSKKGGERKSYLEPLGLTHELDMHNAMFYFMLALLPDTISEADKTSYYGLVKSGRLYDDAVDTLPGASREEIKEKFQRYRNRKGGNKKRIEDIDLYFKQKFPAVRDWMLGQKQMQNRLAWIETDFMSRVCEKLSAGNIRYEWLHDAVYVSEEDSRAASEIWNSVKGEFESVFMK
jgi:hypothetical protein